MASGTVQPLPKTAIPLPMKEIEAFCRKWGVKEFALFGSVLRDDFEADSDVDVLLDLVDDPERSPDYAFEMYDELTSMFGRKIDLVERFWLMRSQNPYRKQQILESARVIHAN